MTSQEVFSAYPISKWENRHFRDLPKEDERSLIRGLITIDGKCRIQTECDVNYRGFIQACVRLIRRYLLINLLLFSLYIFYGLP